MRIVAGVLAGCLLTMVVVGAATFAAASLTGATQGTSSPSYLAANLVLSFGGAVAGGWLAARVGRAALAAWIVAGLLLALSVPAFVTGPQPGQPAWYPYVVALIGVTGALVGGVAWRRKAVRR